MDGKKFNDCKATYALMRRTSDELCREHGLSVIEFPGQGRTMSYDAWEAERKGTPTWYSQIRRDVDACITRSFLFDHFIANLKKQGYEVKRGKYIAVRPPGKERFVRLKTLGNNYTEEAIRQRIREHEQTPLYHRPPSPPRRKYAIKGKPKKLTGFRALYYPINIQANGETFVPKDVTGKEVPVFAYEGTTYAPLRALAEAYGLEVGYDAAANMATVNDLEAKPEQPATPDTTTVSDYSDWSAEDEAAYQEFKGMWEISGKNVFDEGLREHAEVYDLVCKNKFK